MRQDERSQEPRTQFRSPPQEVTVEAIIANPKAKLMEQAREIMRLRHYALRTEQADCDWIRRYVRFHKMRCREELVPGTVQVSVVTFYTFCPCHSRARIFSESRN